MVALCERGSLNLSLSTNCHPSMGSLHKLLGICLLLCVLGAAELGESHDDQRNRLLQEDSSKNNDTQIPTMSSPPPAPATTKSKSKPKPPPKPDSGLNATSTDGQKNGTQTSPNTDEKVVSNNQTEEHHEQETDNSHCCGTKLSACLLSSGDGSDGMLSLVIKSHDSYTVTITTPAFLRADQSEFTTEKEKSVTVKIEMVDAEAAKRQSSSHITIKSEAGTCEIPVPSQYLGFSQNDLLHTFTYSAMRTPVVGLGMLAVALTVVLGAWAYCRYKGKQTHTESPKYQELEMGLPDDNLPTTVDSAAVVRHQRDALVEGDDGWNEVWDDEWEDEEAGRSSSRLTESLSSKGLAARRIVKEKEGWED